MQFVPQALKPVGAHFIFYCGNPGQDYWLASQTNWNVGLYSECQKRGQD